MTRTSRGTLREEHASATRRRIVDALVEQASQRGRADFSIAQVAARAGVSERTVYRYFPNREALLSAIDDAVDAEAPSRAPMSPDDVVGQVAPLFAWFEEHAQLVEASHVTGVGAEVRKRGRKRRGERMRRAIDEWLADLPEADRRRTFAVCRSMFGSSTWRTMRHELGMSPEETVEAVEWVLGLVVADLRETQERAKKRTSAPRKKATKRGPRAEREPRKRRGR